MNFSAKLGQVLWGEISLANALVGTIHNESVESVLSLSDGILQTIEADASNSLDLSDEASATTNRAASADNSLDLSDSADRHRITVTQALGLSSSAAGNAEAPISVSTTLVLNSLAYANAKETTAQSSLAVNQSVAAFKHAPASVETTLILTDSGSFTTIPVSTALSLSDSADASKISSISIVSNLALDSEAESNFKFRSASANLGLTQTLQFIAPYYLSVGHAIYFVSSAGVARVYKINNLLNVLTLSQGAGTPKTAWAQSTLSLTQSLPKRYQVGNSLTLTHSAKAADGRDAAHLLGLQHSVIRGLLGSRVGTNALQLRSVATFQLQRTCLEALYSPFIGENASGKAPPATASIGDGTLTLTFPYVSPSITLTLRNPDFRDERATTFSRVVRDTRGGKLIVYSDPTWPKATTLKLSLSSLSSGKAADLLDFLQASLGKEIGLLDHLGRQWRGVITQPDAEMPHPSRGGRAIDLIFEGELVS